MTGMTLQRLARLLDAYGADCRLWPEQERDAALTLLAESPAARSLQADASRLDALLALAPRAAASPHLAADIIAQAAPSRWRRLAGALWPFGPAWQPAAALAMALMLGIAIGPLLPEPGTGAVDDSVLAQEDGVFAAPFAVEEEFL